MAHSAFPPLKLTVAGQAQGRAVDSLTVCQDARPCPTGTHRTRLGEETPAGAGDCEETHDSNA